MPSCEIVPTGISGKGDLAVWACPRLIAAWCSRIPGRRPLLLKEMSCDRAETLYTLIVCIGNEKSRSLQRLLTEVQQSYYY